MLKHITDHHQVSINQSVLSQIVNQIVTFLTIVNEHPGYLTGGNSDDSEHERYWEEILSSLSTVFKQVAGSVKLKSDMTKPEE